MSTEKRERLSIPWAKPDFWGLEETYVLRALRSTWISGGEFVDRLEREIAAMMGVKHALTASNGTTAIHLAFLALGLQPGDEIIVPGFAFLAAANIALHMHVKPVFADVDPSTWCVDADGIERCVTPRTRLIVAVHTYGNVCPMDRILALADHLGVTTLEDAAESFASRYKGRFAGSMARFGSLSFQATKTITTGEGGMVLTDDHDAYNAMTLFRNHGMAQRRYWHEVPGHNFRLTNLQAAIGCAQLESLSQITAARKRVHRSYERRLASVSGVRPQTFHPDVDPVLWAMAIELDPSAYPQGRDGVSATMAEAGIETRPGFYAASMIPIYDSGPLPIAERLSRNVVSLPTYPTLADEEVNRICDELDALRR